MAVDAGTIYSEVRARFDKLKGDIKQIDVLFNQIGTGTDKVAKKSKSMSLLAVAAFAAVGLAIKKLVTGSVKLFADFEQGMANVASVAKATPKDFERLTNAAREAGETTRFTATQSAGALYYLASAGFDASQSIDALDGVLQLAGATQSDLAFTSEAVASAISQFGLDASDATRVANVFTASITNSQATMEKLATSLRYAGPVAAAFGYTIEDVAGALQILYNNGFEASQAGTALRSALADLSNATSPAIAKLKNLGVSFDEVNPATNSLIDIIGVLNDKVTEGGDIMQIFGDRAGPALIQLIQGGREELEKYTEAVTGTNAAAEAYERQNDTLAGSIDRLKSASESARIGFAEAFAPAIRLLVDLLTKMFAAVSKLPVPLKILVAGLFVLTPAVAALALIIKTQLIPALAGMGTIASTVLLPVTAVVGGLTALAAGIIAIKSAADKANLRKITKEYGDLAEALELTNEQMQDLVKAQKRVGEVTDESLTKLNDFRIELGLTTEELKKLTNQAKFFGLSVESFAIAKTELNLGVAGAKRLDAAFGRAATRIAKGSAQAADEVTELADKFNLTEEQVLKYLLAHEDVTGELKNQLVYVDEEIKKAAELRAGYEAYAKGRIEAVNAIKEAEKGVTEEIENQKKLLDPAEISAARRLQDSENELLALSAKATLLDNEAKLIDAQAKELEKAGENAFYLNTLAAELSKEYFEVAQQIDDILNGVTKTTDETEKENEANKELNTTLENRIDIEKKLRTEQGQARQELIDGIKENQIRIDELGKSELELIEIQRQRAIESIEASQADLVYKEAAIAKVNELYDLLESNEANEIFLDNVRNVTSEVLNVFEDLSSSITDLWDTETDKKLALIDEQLEAALEAAGVAEKTEIESLQAQLAEAIADGDAETAAELQDEIERLQITEKYEAEKAQIEYKAALNTWRIQLALAIANAAAAIIKNFADLGLIAGAIANIPTAIATGVEIASIVAAKPEAPSLATGGIIFPSDSGTLVNAAENGYSEMFFNSGPSGRAAMQEFANILGPMINGAGGGSINVQLNVDGRKLAKSSADYYNNGVVRLSL